MSAVAAIFNAKVKSKKWVKLKDIYDAEKARKEIIAPEKPEGVNLERYRKATAAMKSYKPNMIQKGE